VVKGEALNVDYTTCVKPSARASAQFHWNFSNLNSAPPDERFVDVTGFGNPHQLVEEGVQAVAISFEDLVIGVRTFLTRADALNLARPVCYCIDHQWKGWEDSKDYI
jgi:hypothetical protein